MAGEDNKMIELDTTHEFWGLCYTVHSLMIVGSKARDGTYNFAPKHLAMPLGFGPYFGFMGTPRKSTYQNIKQEEVFTVSYPKPNQLIISSFLATRREEDDSKPILTQVNTVPSKKIEGKFLEDSYFRIECKLSQITGEFGEWELIVGEVVAAYIQEEYLRSAEDDLDAGELIYNAPLLAYLHPDRFSKVRESNAFPFPKDFKR